MSGASAAPIVQKTNAPAAPQSVHIPSGTGQQPPQWEKPSAAATPATSMAMIPPSNTLQTTAPTMQGDSVVFETLATQPPLNSEYIYIRKIGYAIRPFRLTHGQKTKSIYFNLSHDDFKRIWNPNAPKTQRPDPNQLPLSYVFIAWREKTNEWKCEWPDVVHFQINGKAPAVSRVGALCRMTARDLTFVRTKSTFDSGKRYDYKGEVMRSATSGKISRWISVLICQSVQIRYI